VLDQYFGSLEAIGIDTVEHDVRLVEDDWEGPTLGAWGLGWEVWCDGMEITQFTYFQQVGGLDLDLIPAEITYGLERLAMFIQSVDSVWDVTWVEGVTYADVYRESERQWSAYNYEYAPVDILQRRFAEHEAECATLLDVNLPLPAYDQVLKASEGLPGVPRDGERCPACWLRSAARSCPPPRSTRPAGSCRPSRHSSSAPSRTSSSSVRGGSRSW
jgi:glycyl-tRNA synthetase alpha chain